ncbi:hypothetical protein GZH53_15590 [Flavihumibacter sp. R14]|nr:hypothetical protein [Flavihumibacter soli]
MHLRKFHLVKLLTAIFCCAALCGTLAFKESAGLRELAEQTMIKLNSVYQADAAGAKLKKYELLINKDGFFRYRKYLQNGKQEYYSFNVIRFKDLDFLGNSASGTLILRTRSEDVIVQTYNDPKGNIDSMAYQLQLPVKDIEAEDLHLIRENLLQIRRELE